MYFQRICAWLAVIFEIVKILNESNPMLQRDVLASFTQRIS